MTVDRKSRRTAACAENGDSRTAVRLEQEALSRKDDPDYRKMIEAYKKRLTYIEYQKRQVATRPAKE